jgi:putative nucleotidyltransferase with HDIG domain
MMALSIDAVLSAFSRLPTMPDVVVDLMSSFADDEIDSEVLAQKLSRDQALVARVLRVANSPFYGLPRQVSTVQEAIMVLGLANVRTLVTAAAVIAQFSHHSNADFDLPAFWRHSISAACCARVLSVRAGENPNTAFICGLLHDIGRVLLAVSFPEHHVRIAEYRARADCSWSEAERAVIGLDHAAIGEALAARWNFPESLQQAVAAHHRPDAFADCPLAAINHVADVICYALDMGHDPSVFVPALSAHAWATMRLEWGELPALFAEIERMIEGASVLVGAAADSPVASRARVSGARAAVAGGMR